LGTGRLFTERNTGDFATVGFLTLEELATLEEDGELLFFCLLTSWRLLMKFFIPSARGGVLGVLGAAAGFEERWKGCAERN